MGFKDDFLNQRPERTVEDLKVEINMKKATYNISNLLQKQNQKERIKKINAEVGRMLRS